MVVLAKERGPARDRGGAGRVSGNCADRGANAVGDESDARTVLAHPILVTGVIARGDRVERVEVGDAGGCRGGEGRGGGVLAGWLRLCRARASEECCQEREITPRH